jgi:hypothetical protein
VTLAFAASYAFIESHSTIRRAKAYGFAMGARAHTWTASAADGYGTPFMMYLATLLMDTANSSGPKASEKGHKTAAGAQALGVDQVLNKMSRSGMSFVYHNTKSYKQKDMNGQVVKSIQHGVPEMVATQMYLLPSQADFVSTASWHWISVVAYDSSYYYYIDTCWAAMGCGSPGLSNKTLLDPYNASGLPQIGVDNALLGGKYNIHKTAFDATNKNQADRTSLAYRAKYPGTWRISKSDLWRAVSTSPNSTGWMWFTGSAYAQGHGD